ncbi:ATP-dependent DNA ligase [Anaeromyxobacter oryzisoli]|uniref:ATP-dependent DNA ligase n=1 Tax=Anaeromyxobacter oryzisoli TaxID=2925408 RepID=UPI001F576A11|nr:ATP-dependent DNA ligase [Anaeromyxobacter sp. SG63]
MEWPQLDLPIRPPFPPMEARLAEALPAAGDWQFEPKWDGFRCLVFVQGARAALQSKAGQPLGRYFPELVEAVEAIPFHSLVLDGEIVIPTEGGSSFEALLQRIHPAASRVRRLAAETPARFVVFDLLVGPDGRDLTGEPIEVRRSVLERIIGRLPTAFVLSPASRLRSDAEAWLHGVAGTDGVVAKPLGHPYRAGARDMVKVKREETLDAVVGGFRRGQEGGPPASLLLGLLDEAGRLQYVGHTTLAHRDREAFARLLAPLSDPASDAARHAGLGFTGAAPGGPSRWARDRSTEWTPVAPTVVVEVSYRHASEGRLRHGARFVRLRPDKSPELCTLDALDPRIDPIVPP